MSQPDPQVSLPCSGSHSTVWGRRIHRRLGSITGAFVLAVALFVTSARAAEGLTEVTLAQVVALALAHNTDLRSSGQDVASARGARVQAGVFPNPGILVSSLGSRTSPLAAPVPTQFGVTWTLPIGGKRAAGIAAADSTLSASKATNAGVRQQLELNVATQFVNVLLTQALLAFARSDQLGLNKTLELNELRYQDGKIAYGDVLKLRIQALATDDAVRQAEQNLVAARADLAQTVGEGSLASDFAVQGALDPAPAVSQVTPESLLSAALARRPDYLALASLEESAAHSLTQARRQPIPDLGILVDYNHSSGSPDSYDISLSIPIPLFDRNSGNIQQAAAVLEKAHLAREALRNQLRNLAIKTVAEWRSSAAQAKAYGEGIQGARQSLDISRLAYQAGRGSLLDFLGAEVSFRQVESAYRTALARNALAAYSLRFVGGEEIP